LQRRLTIAVVGALLAAHLAFDAAPALRRVTSDFANYYVPARAVVDGGDVGHLYERAAFDRERQRLGITELGSFVPHPPANALLLVPLAALPMIAAKRVWILILVAAYGAAFVALWPVLRATLDGWTLALVSLLPTAALANALAYGQPYPLLLLFLATSLLAATRGRWGWAGVLLSPVLALKLYGSAFLILFVLARRWRAAAGLVLGTALVVAASAALLGREIHDVYWREIFPASVDGRIQDPYSTIWQSGSSLARRLLEREPDLNPQPLLDRPELAHRASRAIPVVLVVGAALCAAAAGAPSRQWAIVIAGTLAASPLAATYHFVLLAVPAAIVLADDERRAPERIAALVLYAFAASSLPHYAAAWAHGMANLLAFPRFFAAVAFLAIVAAPTLTWRRLWIAAVAGLVAATSVRPASPEVGWERLAAGGYLAAEPLACGATYGWIGIDSGHYVLRAADGTHRPLTEGPRVPACQEGRITAAPLGVETEDWTVRFGAPVRHARGSPDRQRVVAQVWRAGSWNLELLSLPDGRVTPLTRDPANEVEPSWSEDGRSILFASDRGRGLGSTALYRMAVP
jgi:hypothetical protein